MYALTAASQVRPPFDSPISRLAPEILTKIWGQVPRASLARIVQVSKTWGATAMGITYLWDHLEFTPGYTPHDHHIAMAWLARAKTLPLTIRIMVTNECPSSYLVDIFQVLAKFCGQIRGLSITAPEHATNNILTFLRTDNFCNLQRLSLFMESSWGFVQFGEHPTNEDSEFQRLSLPQLTTLYCTNPPFIFPTAIPNNITEIVLGPNSAPDMIPWQTMAPALQSTPHLAKLGFHGLMPSLPPPSSLIRPSPISLLALTCLSLRRVHPDSFARFFRVLVAPLLTDLTLEIRANDQVVGSHPEELASLLYDPEFAQRFTTLHIQNLLPLRGDTSFFHQFSNLETLSVNFQHRYGVPPWFWNDLADPKRGGPTFLPRLRHLSLADMAPGNAQELVLLRQQASQPQLECLELLFFKAADVFTARTPTWSYWLASNVRRLIIPASIDISRGHSAFSLFETVNLI